MNGQTLPHAAGLVANRRELYGGAQHDNEADEIAPLAVGDRASFGRGGTSLIDAPWKPLKSLADFFGNRLPGTKGPDVLRKIRNRGRYRVSTQEKNPVRWQERGGSDRERQGCWKGWRPSSPRADARPCLAVGLDRRHPFQRLLAMRSTPKCGAQRRLKSPPRSPDRTACRSSARRSRAPRACASPPPRSVCL